MIGNKSLVVVIRTVGERTFEVCRALLLKQVPTDVVEIVNECPFEKAVQCTFEIGIRSGAKWTMTLDADVLLRDGVVKDFVAEAEGLPENYIQLEGLIHDKLTGIYRNGGPRMWRTQHLKDALQQIPASGTTIRPEYATLQRMEMLGFHSKQISLVMGIHDYEQFFQDIYRKAFVHANKHQIWLADMVSRWKQLGFGDKDYLVALRGLYDGLMALEMPKIDARSHSSIVCSVIAELGLQEKPQIAEGTTDFDFVDRVLDHAGSPPSVDRTQQLSVYKRAHDHYKRAGVIGMVPILVGASFCRLGEALKRIGNQFGKK